MITNLIFLAIGAAFSKFWIALWEMAKASKPGQAVVDFFKGLGK